MGPGVIGLMTVGFAFVVDCLVMVLVRLLWRLSLGGARGLLVGIGWLSALFSVAHGQGSPDGVEPVLRPAGTPGTKVLPQPVRSIVHLCRAATNVMFVILGR